MKNARNTALKYITEHAAEAYEADPWDLDDSCLWCVNWGAYDQYSIYEDSENKFFVLFGTFETPVMYSGVIEALQAVKETF